MNHLFLLLSRAGQLADLHLSGIPGGAAANASDHCAGVRPRPFLGYRAGTSERDRAARIRRANG